MRLFPAVPEGIRRITPATGTTISGHFVPANVSSPLVSLYTVANPLLTGQSQYSALRCLPSSAQFLLAIYIRTRTLAAHFSPFAYFPIRLRQERSASTLLRGSQELHWNDFGLS
jgi:hypothetical protein